MIPCPKCGKRKAEVIDHRRPAHNSKTQTRRRECECGERFTTVERVYHKPLKPFESRCPDCQRMFTAKVRRGRDTEIQIAVCECGLRKTVLIERPA